MTFRQLKDSKEDLLLMWSIETTKSASWILSFRMIRLKKPRSLKKRKVISKYGISHIMGYTAQRSQTSYKLSSIVPLSLKEIPWITTCYRDWTWLTIWLVSYADFLKRLLPTCVTLKRCSIKWKSTKNVETSYTFSCRKIKWQHFEGT